MLHWRKSCRIIVVPAAAEVMDSDDCSFRLLHSVLVEDADFPTVVELVRYWHAALLLLWLLCLALIFLGGR